MKKFNNAITEIAEEVERRGYELMGVKPSSIHPDEYGELFDILVKRDSGRYVVWSVTVIGNIPDFYWGTYFDGDNDRDIFFKALQRFNSK